jgi:hypothetical protein
MRCELSSVEQAGLGQLERADTDGSHAPRALRGLPKPGKKGASRTVREVRPDRRALALRRLFRDNVSPSKALTVAVDGAERSKWRDDWRFW